MTNIDTVLGLFNQWYIDMINDDELIKELRKFESNFKDTDLWFRFFEHDTLATDIHDIEVDLKNNNRSHITENIKMALENPIGFQLNFDTYERD